MGNTGNKRAIHNFIDFRVCCRTQGTLGTMETQLEHTLYILKTIGKNGERETVGNTLGTTGNQVNYREHTEYTLGAPQIMEYRLIRH